MSNPPTPKQKRLLGFLAERTGSTYATPSTRSQASDEISRLQALRDSQRGEEHDVDARLDRQSVAVGARNPDAERGFGDYEKDPSDAQRRFVRQLCARHRITFVEPPSAAAASRAIELLNGSNRPRAAADLLRDLPERDRVAVLEPLPKLPREAFTARLLDRTPRIGAARDLGLTVDELDRHTTIGVSMVQRALVNGLLNSSFRAPNQQADRTFIRPGAAL